MTALNGKRVEGKTVELYYVRPRDRPDVLEPNQGIVHVCGLDKGTTREELKTRFSQVGYVFEVRSNRSFTHFFVEFNDVREALKAVETFNGHPLAPTQSGNMCAEICLASEQLKFEEADAEETPLPFLPSTAKGEVRVKQEKKDEAVSENANPFLAALRLDRPKVSL